MQIKTLVGALASLFIVAAEGKTVAWYHFDGGAEGSRATVDQIITNAADVTSLPAYSRWQSGTTTMDTDSPYLADYARTFPAGVSWLDPVTGAKGDERMGLHCKGVSKFGDGSVIIVNDDEKLHAKNLTAEIFVKFDTAYAEGNVAQVPVFASFYGTGGGDKSWALHVNDDGVVSCQIYIKQESGSCTSRTISIAGSNARDGKWHHLAMTFNGTHVRLYYDYTQTTFNEFHGEISYSDLGANVVCAGANARSSMSRWSGWIDEARITDEALTPDQFLHPAAYWPEEQKAEAAKMTDSDTLVYQSFDTPPVQGDGGALSGVLFAGNEAAGSQALPTVLSMAADGALPTVTDAVAGEKVKGDIMSADPHADVGAWRFASGTTVGHSSMLTVDDRTGYCDGKAHRIFAEDSTVEMICKLDRIPSYQTFLFHAKHQSNENGTQIYCTGSEGATSSTMMVGLLSQDACDKAAAKESWNLYLVNCGTTVSDLKWHQVAVVNARSERRVLVYFDGRLVESVENFLLATNVSTSAARADIRISGRGEFDASDSRQFEGCIDEVRITGRALSPREFVSLREVPTIADGRTCTYLDFDDKSLALKPFAASVPDAQSTDGVTFADLVPGNGEIANRVGMGFPKENVGSLRMQPGSVFYVGAPHLVGLQTQTVEFYAKVEQLGAAPHFVSLETVRTNNSFMAWGIRAHASERHIYVNMDNMIAKGQSIVFDSPRFANGGWHHIAVTFRKDIVDEVEVTEIRLYLDGKEQPVCSNNRHAGTNYVDGGIVRWLEPTERLAIGRQFGGTAYITGYLDEFRISEGVLTPDQFLMSGKAGSLLMVR